MMEDCGDCYQNYKWEMDQAFRATGNKEVDDNMRVNILRRLGIPKTDKNPESPDESTDSDVEQIVDHKVNVLGDPECDYACEKDLGWFDIVQSHSPWDEAHRPYDQILMYEDLSLTDKEKDGNLSGMIMATGMNVLDAVPLTDRFALTKLQLPDKGLKTIQILDSYKYIQYVDLSHNTIQDLSPLDALTYLIVLDASHNEVEHFQPSPTPWFLSYLNLSHNRLKTVPDISSMWSLKHLNLSNNNLMKIQGIKDLSYLEYVNLSYNEIQVLENISKVPLRTLDVSWNKITRCDDSEEENGGLHSIITLQRLDISHNLLESMSDLQCINTYSLRHLNVAYNNFSSVTAFDDLSRYKSLRYLRLEGNSIVSALPELVKNIIHLLPQLAYINGGKLTKSERLGAYSSWNSHMIVKEMKKYCYELLYSNVEPPDYGVETPAHLDYDVPIVILTGPMGTRKYTLVKHIAEKYPEYVKRPVMHSTLHDYSEDNPDVCEECKNLNVNHVAESEFNHMWSRGEFVFVHNDAGDLFGLGKNQLENDGRLVIMGVPIQPAMSMMWQGLNTTLIMVKPASDDDYSDLLQKMVVSLTIIGHERAEAKEIMAMPNEAESLASTLSHVLSKQNEDEEEIGTDLSMTDKSRRSLTKKTLKRSQDSETPALSDPVEGTLGKVLIDDASITSFRHQSISVVQSQHVDMPRFPSPEQRMALDIPFWCSDESLGDIDPKDNEPGKGIPFIENLKTHAGEKERLWALYHNYYPEAKMYYDDIFESCHHLFARTIVIDNLDRAMKKILPLLAEKYNASLKPPKDEEKDPLYDVLVKPRLDEMMEILADRGVMMCGAIGEWKGSVERPWEGGDAMSSEPSKDTLSVPFFSPETSSFEVTPSTSITEFGSEERKLEEPRHVWEPSAPPTPPTTPSSVLERIARESVRKAGFVTYEADQAIKYYHSEEDY